MSVDQSRYPNMLLGRYVLEDTLGSGSGGTVDLAWDTRIERNVAIKRIPLPAHSEDSTIPGLDEARTGAQLHDSRIVNVLDFEVSGNEALLIMEFVDGISLGTLMDRIPRMLNIDEIASVVQNVGKALQHAHQHHVLHLDVKPDNILIDSSGQSKVTDFGIGMLAKSTDFGSAIGGTIGYMPPEQLLGQTVNEQTDQWAFAVMVYELLVGENPFIAPTFVESLEKIRHSEIVLPSSTDEDIDEEVDDILFQAMSIDPENRYPSVADFVTDLMPHLGKPKTGRNRLGKLVAALGDDIPLGSPKERLASIIEQRTRQIPPIPLSEDDDSFYDADTVMGLDDADGSNLEDEGGNSYDERDYVPAHSIRDAVSDRAAGIISRIIGCVCCGALAYLGTTAMSMPTPAFTWAVVGIIAAIGAAWPRFGSLPALLCVSIGLLMADWVPQGVILAIITLVWWSTLARNGDTESNCGIIGPTFGIIIMGYLQPLASGYFLNIKKALLTSIFGVAIMLVIAPITGSNELYHATLGFMEHNTSNDLGAVNIYRQIPIWIAAVGWITSALAMSIFANRGSKALSMVGVVVSLTIMIISRVLGGVSTGIFFGLFDTEAVSAFALPLIAMCFTVWLYTPDRSDR
ncbi:MAG: serine/threonine-protein kinase [Coriobacteriales bacterium]